jgi:hypothetical protein
VAFDPEHRLVVSVVVGKRTEEHTRLLVEDFYGRTEARSMDLITSDEHAPYAAVILEAYGEPVVPPPTGKPGREMAKQVGQLTKMPGGVAERAAPAEDPE